ncbi:hypothetical protein K9N68_00700 [Kovacikia minuta CCNUW1]|uniref:hypothetical protein n=1 Tax=Kovacikia minuta TaxID=2931930 RepID=UPI001CD007FD|nr:hypothetical protein [Kovacikia minuta]UBF26567.1 hypothetical protein K9N68_00700 [Kovacikia minuta CCNUW1]
MSAPLLENRDYTVIIAKTAPSVMMTPPGFHDRWTAAHYAIVTLAQQCESFDPDGITIYVSSKDHPSGSFNQYKQVKPEQLTEIFDQNYPPDTLNLFDGLRTALDDYFARKAIGKVKPNGEIIVVLIDGEPSDRMAIVKLIVDATLKMDQDSELGIGFVQIGDDIIARGFLNALDEDLRSKAGAKFDIVHTRVLDEIETCCLTDFLLDIIPD